MKKFTLAALLSLALILFTNLHAQTTIRVKDTSGVPGSTVNSVNIELDNTMSVGGVQFTLEFDGSLVAATGANTVARSSQMDIGRNTWTDSIMVLLYSISGDSILPGTGPLIEILFDIDSTAAVGDSTLIHVKSATLVDPAAHPISVDVEDGWFHFTAPVVIEENQVSSTMPSIFRLSQNSPNPFVFTTTIRYQLPIESDVSLKIYSYTGQLVRTLVNTRKESGYYIVSWKGRNDNGKRVSAGIYFCKFEAPTGLGTGD